MVRIPRWFGPSTDEARAYAVRLQAAQQELRDAHAALWRSEQDNARLRARLLETTADAGTPTYDEAAWTAGLAPLGATA